MTKQQAISKQLLKLISEGIDTKNAFNQVFEGVMTWEQFAGDLYDQLKGRA